MFNAETKKVSQKKKKKKTAVHASLYHICLKLRGSGLPIRRSSKQAGTNEVAVHPIDVAACRNECSHLAFAGLLRLPNLNKPCLCKYGNLFQVSHPTGQLTSSV